MMTTEPFDFVRYFTRVQSTPFWHEMQLEMATFAQVQPSMRLLDVGCGPGRLVYQLQQMGIDAIGADGDQRMTRRARHLYPSLTVVTTQAEQLPFQTHSFHRVVAGNLLFFLPDPVVALQEIAQVLKPGGWVSIWNPSEQMTQTAAATYAQHHLPAGSFAQKHLVNWAGVAENNRRWSASDLANLFAQAHLINFGSKTTLGGLARYARGQKSVEERKSG